MADRLKVSSDSMKSDYEKMKTLIDKLTANSNEVLDLVEKLSQYYSGPAYETFKQTVYDGTAQMEALLGFWEGYVNAYQEADEKYKNTEKTVYDAIHALKV